MALTKSKGNMYDWVTHTHSHLRGACPHRCRYCYVQAMEEIYNAGHYAGELRMQERELACSYGTIKMMREAMELGFDHPIVFIDHCNDLFADSVPDDWIMSVLEQCGRYPETEFVFQSKNPYRMWEFEDYMPPKRILGTTAESDVEHEGIWDACCPKPMERLSAMVGIIGSRKFVTVEPVLKMRDIEAFADEIALCKPEFVNIGADSKGRGLPEPTREEVMRLYDALVERGVTIRKKLNLERLMA